MRIQSPSRWWGRLPLRAKMVLVAGVPLLVLGAAVPITYLTTRAEERVGDTIENVFEVRRSLATLEQDLSDGETGARGYLLTDDARFLQPYRVGAGSARGDFIRLRSQLQAIAPETSTRLDLLSSLVDRRLELLRDLVKYADEHPAVDIPSQLLGQGGRVMDEIRPLVDELDAKVARILEARRADLDRAQTSSLLVSVAIVPLALFATILIVLWFANGLARRLRRIESNAKHLESGEPLDEAEPGDDELARLGETLRSAAARIAAQDAELRELALVDPLTGLHNRRGFLEIAEHELQVCQRRGSATALLYVDVDGLKVVNDEHGHGAGDRLLREVADVLRCSVRESDVLGRVGGDEFCVLLSRDSAVDGTVLLERLETNVASWNARGGLPFEVSFSVGVGIADPAEPTTIEELIGLADRAMYENKRAKARLRPAG